MNNKNGASRASSNSRNTNKKHRVVGNVNKALKDPSSKKHKRNFAVNGSVTETSVKMERSERDDISEASSDIKLPLIKVSQSDPSALVRKPPFGAKKNTKYEIKIPDISDTDDYGYKPTSSARSGMYSLMKF